MNSQPRPADDDCRCCAGIVSAFAIYAVVIVVALIVIRVLR